MLVKIQFKSDQVANDNITELTISINMFIYNVKTKHSDADILYRYKNLTFIYTDYRNAPKKKARLFVKRIMLCIIKTNIT